MPDIFIGSEEVRVVDGPFTSRVPVVAILNPTTGLPAFPGGSGGGGDANAANQTTLITAFGAQADAMATSDNGTFSFMALIKRTTKYLGDLNLRLPAGPGPRAASGSLSVTQDNDSTWRTRAFQPTSSAHGSALSLTAATSSAAQAVTAGTVIRFGNSGGAPITIEFGTSGVVATSSSLVEILPGTSEAIMTPVGSTHFAAFCASAATLKWVTGTGS
jgi:hypothetical protein